MEIAQQVPAIAQFLAWVRDAAITIFGLVLAIYYWKHIGSTIWKWMVADSDGESRIGKFVSGIILLFVAAGTFVFTCFIITDVIFIATESLLPQTSISRRIDAVTGNIVDLDRGTQPPASSETQIQPAPTAQQMPVQVDPLPTPTGGQSSSQSNQSTGCRSNWCRDNPWAGCPFEWQPGEVYNGRRCVSGTIFVPAR